MSTQVSELQQLQQLVVALCRLINEHLASQTHERLGYLADLGLSMFPTNIVIAAYEKCLANIHEQHTGVRPEDEKEFADVFEERCGHEPCYDEFDGNESFIEMARLREVCLYRKI